MSQNIGKKIDCPLNKDITGSAFGLQDLNEKPIRILGFANRHTGNRMNELILKCLPQIVDKAYFIQVLDVSGLPKLVRKLPEIALNKEYHDLVKKMVSQDNTEETMKKSFFMVPDWEGSFVPGYFSKEDMENIHIFVIDSNDQVIEHLDNVQGDPEELLLEKISQL